MKRPNPLPPDKMTPAERRVELCCLLALGLVRLHVRQSSGQSAGIGDIPLHNSPDQSGHTTPNHRRTA